MPKGHVKGFETQNDESNKRQFTDNIPLRDVIRTFMVARYKKCGLGLQIPTRKVAGQLGKTAYLLRPSRPKIEGHGCHSCIQNTGR